MTTSLESQNSPRESPVAIITGTAGGIGAACVRAFMQAGYRVAMADIDPHGEMLTASFEPGRCRFYVVDMAVEDDIRGLIERTVSDFGRLDLLFNNAGLGQPDKPVHETTCEEFDRVVAVNLRGTFLACKYAYPHLRAVGGSILNMSSMAGVHGEKHHAAYAATKGGINALTMALAIDYGREGVRCNAVCPSSVLTPKVDSVIAAQVNAAEIVELRKNINLLGYTSTPEEIAGMCVFLASPAASFITGAIIPISGGTECGYGIKY